MLGMRKKGFIKWTIYAVVFFFVMSLFLIGAMSYYSSRSAKSQMADSKKAYEEWNNPLREAQKKFDSNFTSLEKETPLVVYKDGKPLITLKDVAQYYMYLPAALKVNFKGEEGKKQLLELLLREKLLLLALKERGMDIENAVDMYLMKLEKQEKDKGISLREQLLDKGFTYDQFRRMLISKMAYDKFQQLVIADHTISDKKIKEFYDKHKDDMYKGKSFDDVRWEIKYKLASNISEKQLKDYYNKHIYLFKNKDKLKLYHLALKVEDYLDKVKVDDKEIEQYYQENKDKFKTPRYVKPLSIFISKDSPKIRNKLDFSEAKLKEFYEKHKNNYLSSKGIKISYMYFPATPTSQDIEKISDEEARKYYDSHLKDYTTPPMVKAKHILVKDEALAKQLLEKIKSGESFEDLAREYSEDKSNAQKGGDLDWFAEGVMVKPFEKAAFAAKVGEVVGPVKTRFGYHLIKVEDKKGGETKSFAEIKEGIKELLAKEKLKEKMSALAEKARKEAVEGKADFFALVKKYSLGKSKEFNGVAGYFYRGESPRLGDSPFGEAIRNELFVNGKLSPIIENRIFRMEKGEISEVVETPKGYYIIKMMDEKMPEPLPLEKIKERVKKDWEAQQRHQIARKLAEEVIEKLSKGEDFSQLAREYSDGTHAKDGGQLIWVRDDTKFSPEEKKQLEGELIFEEEIPYALRKSLFSLKKGEYTKTPVATRYGYHILKVIDVKEPQIKPLEEVKKEIKMILEKKKAQLIAEEEMNKLKKSLMPITEKKFKEVARMKSVTPSSKDGGYIGFISQGQLTDTDLIKKLKDDGLADATIRVVDGQYRFGYFLHPEIEKAIFENPKENSLIGPVKTHDGYIHLFYVAKIKEGEVTPFKDVKDEIKESLTLAIDPKKLKEFYETNKESFKSPAKYKFAHILVPTEAEAKKLYEDIKSGKIGFESKMEELKKGELADYQRIIGPVGPDEIPSYLLESLGKLKINQVSPPIKAEDGYHLVKLLDKTESKMPTFAQIAPFMEEKFLNQKIQKLLENMEKELKLKYKIRYKEDNFKLLSKLIVLD